MQGHNHIKQETMQSPAMPDGTVSILEARAALEAHAAAEARAAFKALAAEEARAAAEAPNGHRTAAAVLAACEQSPTTTPKAEPTEDLPECKDLPNPSAAFAAGECTIKAGPAAPAPADEQWLTCTGSFWDRHRGVYRAGALHGAIVGDSGARRQGLEYTVNNYRQTVFYKFTGAHWWPPSTGTYYGGAAPHYDAELTFVHNPSGDSLTLSEFQAKARNASADHGWANGAIMREDLGDQRAFSHHDDNLISVSADNRVNDGTGSGGRLSVSVTGTLEYLRRMALKFDPSLELDGSYTASTRPWNGAYIRAIYTYPAHPDEHRAPKCRPSE